jgi:hypothetical protein
MFEIFLFMIIAAVTGILLILALIQRIIKRGKEDFENRDN